MVRNMAHDDETTHYYVRGTDPHEQRANRIRMARHSTCTLATDPARQAPNVSKRPARWTT